MPTTYLLDTGPLGLLAHSRVALRKPIQDWILQEAAAGADFFISEVADYEVRRELARLVKAGQLPASRIARLDRIAGFCTYLPVSSAVWKHAADLWADARAQGRPTASPDALDADVLVAAQALSIGATVVTGNPAHIGRWALVRVWP